MKTKEEILQILKANKTKLMEKYPFSSMALFGSFARNEQTEKSDVDIAIDKTGAMGLRFFELQIELEKLLHQKVDLVIKNSIKSHYLPYIEPDLIYV